MWKSSCRFIILLSLLFQTYATAQNEKAAIPLKQLLDQIGLQHEVNFNYIEDEIVIFKIVPPPKKLTLKAKINYIKKETKLKFSVINQKYYMISNNHKVDKPLCGFLIDAETKLPIENAMVSIKNTSTETATNEKGYFELPIISPNDIVFKHQSYESKSIEARDLYVSDCLTLILNPVIQELTEVIAQQYLTTGISKKKDGTIEIKPKKFGILPGLIEPDVLQTLQQIPGIYSADETITNLNVRGGTHDQNLFLWNGIRMFQTGHFFGLISAFNPSLAHTISISKNGSSAFFGESVSSVVAISTHSKNIEESKSSISSNLISTEFYSKIKLTPKASFEISGRRSLTDFFSSTTYQNYRNRIFQNTIITDLETNTVNPVQSKEHFYFYDVTLQYQQKIGNKHELIADAITIRNNLNVDQTKSNTQKNSFLSQENLGGAIRWRSNWNANHTSQINISSSYYNLDATRESIQNTQIFNQSNSVLDFGIQFKHIYQWSKTMAIHAGYQWNETGITNSDAINTPAFSRNIKEVSVSHIGIGEMQYQSLNSKTYLTVGSRVNYFEKYEKYIVEPRIQVNQTITKPLSIEILGEQKSQTLSQIIDLQQDFLGIEKRRWTMANDTSIPIQKSNQLSIGLTFKNKQWLVTLESFYKKIIGITSNGQGFQNQFEFLKADGDYKILGTEVLVQRQFKKVNAWLSYSYNDNRYRFKTLNTTDFPNNFELIHALSAAVIYDWNTVKIALGGKWHSGKPITNPLNNILNTTNPAQAKIDYDLPNDSHLPEYFQLNFSASKDWKLHQKITLQTSLSVLNVLNNQNIIHRYYRINANQNGIEKINTYSLQRTPNLNIKLSF